MYMKDIMSNINLGKNQTLYGQDMFKIYKNLVKELYKPKKTGHDSNYRCIYIDTQTDKEIVIAALKEVKYIKEDANIEILPKEELIKFLIATLSDVKLIIVYNYLEDVTNNRVKLFQRLMRHKVLFIAGFQKMPKKELMDFFNIHEFVNAEFYATQIGNDNIDITYLFYIFITLFMVLIFLRIVSLGTIGDIVSSALWFGLLVFRTFSYIGGRV